MPINSDPISPVKPNFSKVYEPKNNAKNKEVSIINSSSLLSLFNIFFKKCPIGFDHH